MDGERLEGIGPEDDGGKEEEEELPTGAAAATEEGMDFCSSCPSEIPFMMGCVTAGVSAAVDGPASAVSERMSWCWCDEASCTD